MSYVPVTSQLEQHESEHELRQVQRPESLEGRQLSEDSQDIPHQEDDNDNQRSSAPDSESTFPKHTSKDSSSDIAAVAKSKWTIGWRTPATIGIAYVFSIAIAAGHLLFFRFLDGERVSDHIPQAFVSAISTAFITAFSTCPIPALSYSMTQILWYLLRSYSMRLSTIDSLFSITTSPLNLCSRDVVRNAPLMCLCALVRWCIPVAMIYPPGALIVVSHPFYQTRNMTVPTFSAAYRGNGTYGGLVDNDLFQTDDFGGYSLDRAPKDNLRRIGTQCIVGGSYLRSTSPCGQNCSYGLEIDGPGYKCEDHANINSTALLEDVMGAFDIGGLSVPWTFVAAEDFAAAPYYKFSVQSSGLSAISSNTSCVAYKVWYKLNITYVNGVQNITAVSQLYDKLNSSQFWNDGSMYPSGGPGANAVNVTLTNSTQGVMPVGSLVDLHYRSNIAAIKDALVVPLRGLIADEKVLHSVESINTLYKQWVTRGASPAQSLEMLMHDIAVSMLTLNQHNTTTPVFQTTYANTYSFAHPIHLILPYFLSLFVAALFIAAGFAALLRNGIAANTRSFLQILVTTRGSNALDQAAMQGCLGGDNIPETLNEMRVRYGELVSASKGAERKGQNEKGGGKGGRVAGFGVPEEVRPLVRGETYGGW